MVPKSQLKMILHFGVVRPDPSGNGWWILNRRDRGFGERGSWHVSLAELNVAWGVSLSVEGKDAHGIYFTLQPHEPYQG